MQQLVTSVGEASPEVASVGSESRWRTKRSGAMTVVELEQAQRARRAAEEVERHATDSVCPPAELEHIVWEAECVAADIMESCARMTTYMSKDLRWT